jgi:hypothetical protein
MLILRAAALLTSIGLLFYWSLFTVRECMRDASPTTLRGVTSALEKAEPEGVLMLVAALGTILFAILASRSLVITGCVAAALLSLSAFTLVFFFPPRPDLLGDWSLAAHAASLFSVVVIAFDNVRSRNEMRDAGNRDVM